MIRWLAKVVETDTPPVAIEAGVGGRAAQNAPRNVVVEERRSVRGREHVVRSFCESGAALVLAQDRRELGEEGDLANGRACLRRYPARRDAFTAAGKLMSNPDHPGGEVDILPAEREQFGEPHPRERPRQEERPIAARAGGEESGELRSCEDALVGADRMRPLVPLKARERMLIDVAAPEGVAEHAAERTQDPFDRPGREAAREQLTGNCDNIVRRDRCDSAAAELRKQMEP